MVTARAIKAELRRRQHNYDATGNPREYGRSAELQSMIWWIEEMERAEQERAFEEGPGVTLTGDTMKKLAEEDS